MGLSAGLIAIAAASYAIAALTKSRSLPPNGLIGIRTRATRLSGAAWTAGHDAARPALLTSSAVSVSGAIGLTLLGISLDVQHSGDAAVVIIGVTTYAVALALVAWASVKANTAARDVGRD